MASILHKRKKVLERRRQAEAAKSANIPEWEELKGLGEPEARALAERLGIEWTSRMETIGKINRART